MARTKKPLDYVLVEKLAHIQCTQEEIAEALDVSVRTLQRDSGFCRIYKKQIGQGRASLRRLQWQALNEGDKTMLVWLGKQYLGQKDKWETTGPTEVKIRITVEDDDNG